MNYPRRARAQVIAIAMPVEQQRRAGLLSAVTMGAIATVVVYVVAALLS